MGPLGGFQLTRPRGTRHGCGRRGIWLSSFNSRVRGGRDDNSQYSRRYIVVSTHASAGDATWQLKSINPETGVSTHASAGDATIWREYTLFPLWSFNSRVRGGRDARPAIERATGKVSTHASAGDATEYRYFPNQITGFQLTRPRGTRQKRLILHVTIGMFQLTRPRGTRPP